MPNEKYPSNSSTVQLAYTVSRYIDKECRLLWAMRI